MENKKTIIGIIIVVILIIALIAASYLYYDFSNKQLNILKDETNSILQSNILTDEINSEIKTDRNFAIVEKSIKEYIGELKNKYTDINNMYSELNPNDIFSAQNLEGTNMEKAKNTIENFKNLEHRMEFVAEINDVKYYNDSRATIPEATINAVDALKNVNTLLVGGKDRGVELDSLYEYLKKSNIENIIC